MINSGVFIPYFESFIVYLFETLNNHTGAVLKKIILYLLMNTEK